MSNTSAMVKKEGAIIKRIDRKRFIVQSRVSCDEDKTRVQLSSPTGIYLSINCWIIHLPLYLA